VNQNPSLLRVVSVGSAASIAMIALAVSVGSVSISPTESLAVVLNHLLPLDIGSSVQADAIVWNIRMPRVIVAMLSGAMLGVAGAVLQGTLKNPIADPQLVGLSASASVGALLGFWLGYAAYGPAVAVIAGAGAGLVGAWIVQRLASKVGGEPTRFALVGIGAGLSLSALVAAASIAIHDPRVPGVAFWFFGGLGAATWPVAGVLAVAVAVSVGGVVPFSGRLDVLSLGHQPAKHVGVNVKRVLGVGMTLIGLGVGASVGAAGVVGFVGLLGGRFALGLVGPHHRVAIPAAAFTGALFMTGADVIGRVGGRGFEVPVGLTTTVLGGAYLVWLIARKRVPV
jgi:iron complex transport system permease protein